MVTPPVAINAKEPAETDELWLFRSSDYLTRWERFAADGNVGIILTNTSGLEDATPLMEALRQYCEARKSQVRYTVLDYQTCPGKLSEANCESIVRLLNEIYSVAVPDYLMIVGDGNTVPFIKWENECCDDDSVVPSDLAYITLNVKSPWSGQEYCFDGATKVGRVPASAVNGYENAIRYLRFTATYRPQKTVKPFAYTASTWIPTSKNVFADLDCPLVSSPDYTSNRALLRTHGLQMVPDVSEYNLLGFNLHGSDGTHDWYGQIGRFYPEAFDPTCLPRADAGYTICVEACYGARPTVQNKPQQSIVVSALSDKCVSFVGSTRIAYGATDGGMCCADIIAYSFMRSVMDGKTAGEAFLDALTDVYQSGADEECIKTLAEFALYGDPSLTPFATAKVKAFASAKSKPKRVITGGNESRAIKLIPCDGETAKFSNYAYSNYAQESKQAKKVVKIVHEMSDGYVAKNYSAFASVRPMIYKVAGEDAYRTVYKMMDGDMKTIVKLHVDGEGNVQKTYVSK
jgi:hypothetical protein